MAWSKYFISRLLPKPLQNKYIFTAVVFVSWLFIFDKHNLFEQWRLNKSIDQLRNDKDNFTNKIIEAKREGELLKKNGEAIAREKYFMSKKGEDVFIISEE
ncbi:MAG: septum formation initiator family protein [Saprospiraceae bacterium]|jgi:cell division protein FtsB|nr:septum formation initiator family protein [Saprospiraceae bacterium]MCF8299638.1 septum formation initiator family protein [Haliscomenobacter sp.]MCF8317135.1 septum formation initiator family protein [Haliscomenobacter sp.]